MNIKNSIKQYYQTYIKNNYIVIIILAISLLLYNYVWDIIVSAKIYSMQASVYDLGVFYQRLWIMFHIPTFNLIIDNIQNSAIVILMSPLSLIHSLFFFVYLQTFWLSFTVIPLYFIAYKQLKSKFLSLLIAVSFLLFFGIAGINWFDVHFQSLFIPLFISGFALMLYGKNKPALILLILSGLTRFPYIIFPLLLGLSYIVEKLYYKDFSIKKNLFYYSLFIIALFFTIIGYIHIGSVSGVASDLHGSTNYLNNFKLNLDNKIFTFFLLLGPFLMIPLLMKRWALLMVQFFFMVFFSGFGYYVFPEINIVQYYTGIVPFLYLGFIEGISIYYIDKGENKYKHKLFNFKFEKKHRIVVTMFILIILLGTVYEPYGILNKDTNANFNLSGTMDYNMTDYKELNKIINLIPGNNPYVLYSDHMPEVLLRDPVAQSNYVLSPLPDNYTFYIDHHWTNNINYIIVDPSTCLNYSLMDGFLKSITHYMKQGNYGIEAEYSGIVLLAKGYTGKPAIYGAEKKDIPTTELSISPEDSLCKNKIISGSNLTDYQTLWYGPYTYLQPGNYTLTLEVKASNISQNNSFQLRYSYITNPTKGPIDVNLFNVTGSNLTSADMWENITFHIEAKYFYDKVEFAGQDFHWSGNFSLNGISLKQTSAL